MRFHPELNRYVEWDVLLLTPIVYLAIIFSLRAFMKDREAMKNLKPFMLLYNWVQVIVSGTMTVQLFKLMGFPNVFAIGSEFTAHAEFWIFIHYLSKFLDMFDTIFIVLRKNDKQFSFLHIYHHASIGVIWGMLLLTGYGNGSAYYGAWVNSFVHTVMYFHYAWVAMGFRNPFKKQVTSLQISQFYSCMLHATFAFVWDDKFPYYVCGAQLLYHISMIALFTGFFRETYKRSSAVLSKIPAEDITSLDVSKQDKLTQRKKDGPLPAF